MTYDIHTDIKHGPLEVIDAGALAAAAPSRWWNQSLCLVNASVVRAASASAWSDPISADCAV